MWPARGTRSSPSPACGGGRGGGSHAPMSLRALAPSRRASLAPLPRKRGRGKSTAPSLTTVVTTLAALGKSELPQQIARWLDELDETGRWALLKLVTGGLAHRGVGAAGQDRGGVARREGRQRDRADLARPRAALCGPLRLGRRPRRQAGRVASDAVPPGDAVACDRGGEFFRSRSRRLHGGMEMGRHPGAGGGGAARRRRIRDPALFPHRRGHLEELSRSRRGAAFRRRHRRRAPDHARRPGAVLQRAAATAEPQDGDAKADGRFPGASARL